MIPNMSNNKIYHHVHQTELNKTFQHSVKITVYIQFTVHKYFDIWL